VGHSQPMHSVPMPINVRCYSNSDVIVRRSEVTLRARLGQERWLMRRAWHMKSGTFLEINTFGPVKVILITSTF
jgi:hypothetical protein